MQMALDLSTGLQLLTISAVSINVFVSLRSRIDVAELKFWIEEKLNEKLSKYKLAEDCGREMSTHREDIRETRGFFARWQPGMPPPTDKR